MLEWSRSHRILVLTLSRPELADRRPNWGAGQRNFVALHLEPLPDEAMAELVRRLVPGADEGAAARIVERAEGVPLYAVETIRMLADRGVLRAGEDAYELVGDLGELQVPETLHALVASRLDALGPDDRALLQDAAVLGKSFTLDSLSAVTGADGASLEPRLLDLVRKEFLLFEADPRSPERGQCAFVQSMIREVAYGMLSKADRRSRHLATAHHFEAAHDDELAGVVAAHYLEAFRATPEGPDADALAARARDWLGQATERATSLGSPEQALVFAEQALAITPGGIERTDLLQQAARAANDALHPLDERIAYLQEAVDILHDLDDPNADVVMMGALVDTLGDAARLDDVRSVVREMERRLGDGGGDLARAELDLARAEEHVLASDMDVCLRCIDPALAGFERAQAWGRFWPSIQLKALVLANLGRHREAMTIRRGILAVATEEDDLRTMSMTLLLLGTALAEEDVHESLRCTLEAAAIARRGGYGIAEVGALTNGVEAAVEAGEWSRADDLLADLRSRTGLPTWVLDAIALRTALLAAYRGQEDDARSVLATLSDETLHAGHAVSRADHRRTLACVDLMTGDLQGGYEEAMAAIDEEPEGMNSPAAAWNAGCAALWLGDAPKARAPLERTLPLPGRWVASTRRAIEAGIAALEGYPQEAAAEYESVLSGLLSRGDRFTHAVATIDAVAVLPEDLVPAGAVEAARTYLEDLGAEALLARLRSVGAPVATER